MKPEIKIFKAEFKVDEEKHVISGYISTFWNVDSYRDVILPGAFDHTNEERVKSGMVKLLLNHSWDDVRDSIGLIPELIIDSKGVFVNAEYAPEDREITEVIIPRIKKGIIDSFSIGFYAKKSRWATDEEKKSSNVERFLEEIELWEASLVTFGANNQARITAVKSLMAERYPDPEPEPEPDYKDTVEIEIEMLRHKFLHGGF